MQEAPNPEANSCSRRVEVRLDDVYPMHVYNSDVFIDHAHWLSKNKKAARNRVLSIECVEPFTFKASKRAKIVTIGSPKAFLMLRSIFVGLTVATSLDGPTVARISYIRQ